MGYTSFMLSFGHKAFILIKVGKPSDDAIKNDKDRARHYKRRPKDHLDLGISLKGKKWYNFIDV